MSSSAHTDGDFARRALTVLLWAALLLGVAVLVLGLIFVAADLASHDDFLDGIGVLIGLAAAVPALLIGALAHLALRRAKAGPGGGRGLSIFLGVLLVAPVLLLPGAPWLLVPAALGVCLAVVAGLGPSVAKPDGSAR